MNISIPYNKENIDITIPDNNFAGLVEPQDVTSQEAAEKLIRTALDNCL